MPNILVRNLSEDTVAALKRRAAGHGRSLQQEIRLFVERLAQEPQEEDFLEAMRRIRDRLAASGHVFANSTDLIREDRDSR